MPPQSNSIHQLIPGIPVENTLYNSQEKQWNTNRFQILDSMVESMLQDIPWLYNTFWLDLCYSPTLKRIASIANIPRILFPHVPVWLGSRQALLSEATHTELYNSITGTFQAKNNVGAGTNEQKVGKEKAQLQVISHPHPEGSLDFCMFKVRPTFNK